MRIVTVLGALAVGVGLGSAAILTPIMMGGTGVKDDAAQSGFWGSQWGQQALQAAKSLTGKDATAQPQQTASTSDIVSASDPKGTANAAKADDNKTDANKTDAKTIDFLAHPAGSKTADARIIEQPWKAQVTVTPESAAPRKLTSSKPSSDEQRQSLVRDLQIELKRVGCYDGDTNGQWNAASKKAMASFTDRVNATLPFEQPDFILLTLVQGHKGRACGQDCPAGQNLTENGRCTPKGVLAQSERKPADNAKREAAAAAAAAAATLTATKLAEAKLAEAKLADSNKSPDRATIASSWTTTTRVTPLETGTVAAVPTRVIRPPQPVADTPVVVATAPEAPARPAAALPGRMAIGAPLPAPEAAVAVAPAPAPTVSKPARPATRVAAAQAIESNDHASEPVTTSRPAIEPPHRAAPRIHRPAPRIHAVPQAQIRRPQETVHVRRPPPPPRYYAPQQKFANASSGSKSRRMVYELFQRPDRN